MSGGGTSCSDGAQLTSEPVSIRVDLWTVLRKRLTPLPARAILRLSFPNGFQQIRRRRDSTGQTGQPVP
jgi:hypothetical protein